MAGLGQFLTAFWRVLTAVLGFNITGVQGIVADARAEPVILAIALIAGMALLLGQSAILFVNQVSLRWFAVSMMLSGVLYVFRIAVWAVVIWLVTTRVFAVDEPLRVVWRIVGLGSAPFVFGSFILVPYLGPLIARLLYLWGALIVLDLLRHTLRLALLPALLTIVGSWLLVQVGASLLEKPFDILRDRWQRRIAGVPWVSSPQKNLIAVATALFARPTEGEGGR